MNIEIIPSVDDGSSEPDLHEYVYLHLVVKVDGEIDGRLSGYFLPAVAAFIRQKLGVETRK